MFAPHVGLRYPLPIWAFDARSQDQHGLEIRGWTLGRWEMIPRMIGIVETGRSEGKLEVLMSLKEGIDARCWKSIHGVDFGCPKARISLVPTER